MFPNIDEIPTSTSMLMQCGYRSKVCTKVRATKIDGSLHKLCEFHRRKANANQQRLHKRQREERVKRRRTEAEDCRPAKKPCPAAALVAADPIPFAVIEPPLEFGANIEKFYPSAFFAGSVAPSDDDAVDMELLELLLFDIQPQPAAASPPNSPLCVDEISSIIV
ncbi:unnamed protein product [Phytophthora fragariaefolia]|uniref:Unnamed protein product n=1 Tax=Phytophthora fragariaefolia TaxID=1490495 RepID=A0A9W6XT49_9STRA|nr:unnamed protein product [Phytophthora fragariaefolia]